MPVYRFRNKETNEEWEEYLSVQEKAHKLETDPNIELMPKKKPSDLFSELNNSNGTIQ